MKKPSMFSKNYDKEIKRRKKIIILLIIVPIIGLSIFLSTDFSGLLNKSKDNKKTEEVVKEQSDSKKPEDLQAETKLKAAAALKAKATLKAEADLKANAEGGTLIATMPNGEKISIECNVIAGEKNIKGVLNNKDILYDISPSKKAIVMQSKKSQDLLYFDINKISKDITKKVHISSKNESFPKLQKLNESPNYVWSINPKFIDEDNIAYVSELPWMNEKALQYIWKIDLKSNIHMQAKPASGTKITFGKITSMGLEANVDGKTMYVNSSGKVTQ